MKTLIAFRRMEGTEGLKQRVKDRLSKLDRYFPSNVEAHVVLGVEKHRYCVEITLQAPQAAISASSETDDAGTAIDKAVDSITRQVKRYKQKRKDYRAGRPETVETV